MLNLLLTPLFLILSLIPTAETEPQTIEEIKKEISELITELRSIKLENFLEQRKEIDKHTRTLKQPELFKAGKMQIKCKGSGFLFVLENGNWICHEAFPYRTIKLPEGKYTVAFSNKFGNDNPMSQDSEFQEIKISYNNTTLVNVEKELNIELTEKKSKKYTTSGFRFKRRNSSFNHYPENYKWWN